MKWIKLFEGFDQDTKIQWVNDIFFYHRITQDLHEMNLAKIETAQNIYFYSLSRNIKHLKFVLQKKVLPKRNILSYPLSRIRWYKKNYCPLPKSVYKSKYDLAPVYKKAVSDFFENYQNIKVNFRKVELFETDWNRLRSSFTKTKAYKS